MAGQSTFEWVEPTGGVVGLVRFRPEVAVDTDRFYEVLLAEHGTYVGPGHWFELDDRHFRLGYGWPTHDELRAGLAGLLAAAGRARGDRARSRSSPPCALSPDRGRRPRRVELLEGGHEALLLLGRTGGRRGAAGGTGAGGIDPSSIVSAASSSSSPAVLVELGEVELVAAHLDVAPDEPRHRGDVGVGRPLGLVAVAVVASGPGQRLASRRPATRRPAVTGGFGCDQP